jgi:Esterase/lipase
MQELSIRAKIISDIVQMYNHTRYLERKIENENYGESEMGKHFKYPDNYSAEIIEMDNFRMEFLKRTDIENEWAVLHFHGGGYLSPFTNHYRIMAGLYSEAADGASVLSVDYRVAPEHLYPAAVDDAYESYKWLLEKGYNADRIVLGGDSAGGGLAMALCYRLKKLGLALPAGIVAMSPWTDQTISGESYISNRDIDPVFNGTKGDIVFDNPYSGDEDPENPEISPLFGDFTGFPPMLIQVGTEEILFSDSESAAQKAKEAGVKVRFTKYEGMFHVFQLSAMLMPESKNAWFEVKKFMKQIMGMDAEEDQS